MIVIAFAHIQGLWLVIIKAICRQRPAKVHDEVMDGAVARVHDVRLVLEQCVDTLDDVTFTKHDLVPHGHEPVLHAGFQAVHQVYAVGEQRLEQLLLDISPVGKDLPEEHLGEHVPHTPVAVVDVGTCKTERYYLPAVIAEEVQLEAVAPAHRTPTVGGVTFEHLVVITSHVVAYRYHRAVHVRYSRTMAESGEFHEHHHKEKHPWHQLDEPVVGDRVGEITVQVSAYEERVVLLEIGETAEVVTDDDGHHLAVGHAPFPVSATLAVLRGKTGNQVLLQLGIKILAEFIDNTKYFYNFVCGNHQVCAFINLLIFTHKGTKYPDDYQLL